MKAKWCFAAFLLQLLLGQAVAKPSFVSRMIPHPHTQSPNFSHSESSLARMMQLQAQVYHGTIGTKIFDLMPIVTPMYMIAIEMPYSAYKNVTVRVGLDTGSSFFWVKCSSKEKTAYKPFSSPSFRRTEDCSNCIAPMRCDLRPVGCMNIISYKSGQEVTSVLGFERVSFQPILFDNEWGNSRNSISTFDDIFFGCAGTLKGFDFPKLDGILGLGMHPSSILSQIGATQFSHCIGNSTSSPPPGGIGDVFIVGDDEYMDYLIIPNPESTPFDNNSQHYQVSLVGISFGETWISVGDDHSDTIFDLGASLSALFPLTYDALFHQISTWMQDHSFQPALRAGSRVCYLGNLEDLKDEFPKISYHFYGGAILQLDKYNLFMQASIPQRICLNLMDPDDTDDYSYNLVGQTLQKNHYIKYDLVNKRMHMTKVDCAGVLEDSVTG